MKIEWLNHKNKLGFASFQNNCITFNMALLQYFKSNYVRIGVDSNLRKIIVQPLSNETIDIGAIDEGTIYKISINKSYGRITNKGLIGDLVENYHFNINDKKFTTSYDEKNDIIIIDLDKEVI